MVTASTHPDTTRGQPKPNSHSFAPDMRMIEMVAIGATSNGKPVGVCGEAAADPMLALVLAGLGSSGLSMAPRALAAVGRSLAEVTFELCQTAARAARDSDSPASARKAVRAILDG
jgi:phosphoenolpyruvate-protein phosphotransferase (PTS system enzyme I)